MARIGRAYSINGSRSKEQRVELLNPRVLVLPNQTGVWSHCRPIVGHVTPLLRETSVGEEPKGGREDPVDVAFKRRREDSRGNLRRVEGGWRSLGAPYQPSVASHWHLSRLRSCRVSEKFKRIHAGLHWLISSCMGCFHFVCYNFVMFVYQTKFCVDLLAETQRFVKTGILQNKSLLRTIVSHPQAASSAVWGAKCSLRQQKTRPHIAWSPPKVNTWRLTIWHVQCAFTWVQPVRKWVALLDTKFTWQLLISLWRHKKLKVYKLPNLCSHLFWSYVNVGDKAVGDKRCSTWKRSSGTWLNCHPCTLSSPIQTPWTALELFDITAQETVSSIKTDSWNISFFYCSI